MNLKVLQKNEGHTTYYLLKCLETDHKLILIFFLMKIIVLTLQATMSSQKFEKQHIAWFKATLSN